MNRDNINSFYRIAIIGSDEATIDEDKCNSLKSNCEKLGEILSNYNVVVFCGGDFGVAYYVVKSFSDKGGLSVSFFPEMNNKYKDLANVIPVCTGLGYGIREIVMLRSVEAVITLSGGAGTLAEIANAYHLGIPIFTLRNSGGWSEKLCEGYIDKRAKTQMIVAETYEELVENLIKKCKINRKYICINNMIEKGKKCEKK